MTKKELDIFIEHLLQVWKPHHVNAWQFMYLGGVEVRPSLGPDDYDYAVVGHIELKDRLTICFSRSRWTLQYLDEEGYPAGTLCLNTRAGKVCPKFEPRPKVLSETDAQFINADGHINSEWHLIFRRNCWLSGIKIKCSPEERAEGVKGYTYRQIDEWNSVLMGDERHLRL
jgi:hypothetical protein